MTKFNLNDLYVCTATLIFFCSSFATAVAASFVVAADGDDRQVQTAPTSETSQTVSLVKAGLSTEGIQVPSGTRKPSLNVESYGSTILTFSECSGPTSCTASTLVRTDDSRVHIPTVQANIDSPIGGVLENVAKGNRPRVIVSTDIGGSDPDDFQSLVHLLLYTDVIEVEGLISSPPNAGRAKDILEVIDAYASDYEQLKSHSTQYPAPLVLRNITKQGAVDKAPQVGWGEPTVGSRWIVHRAQAVDERPLWILVWGSITDVAQAVHDEPSIKNKVRVYSIGSWNTRHDSAARDYLFNNHSDLWWIENDSTFRGMYMGGRQDGEWGNRSFVQQNVKGHGSLGELFFNKKPDIKMGDTPSLLYLLRGNAEDPTAPHWGGAFAKTDHGEHFWTDSPDHSLSISKQAGAKTVSDWRRKYLEDWKRRMDRLTQR